MGNLLCGDFDDWRKDGYILTLDAQDITNRK